MSLDFSRKLIFINIWGPRASCRAVSAARKSGRAKMRSRVEELLSYTKGCALSSRPLPRPLFPMGLDYECRFLRDMRRGVLLSHFCEEDGPSKQGMIEFADYLRGAIIIDRTSPSRTLYKLTRLDVLMALRAPVRETDWAAIPAMLARLRFDANTLAAPPESQCEYVHGE